jgi:hypothetical protein
LNFGLKRTELGFITHKPRWKQPMVVVELNTCWVAKNKVNPNIQNGFLKTAPTLTLERDSQTPNFGNIISLFDFSQKGLLPHGEFHGLWDKAEKACKKACTTKLLT